jgi:hypothetical protein
MRGTRLDSPQRRCPLHRQIDHSDLEIVSGTPVFVPRACPAQALLHLEGGATVEEFLDDFPKRLPRIGDPLIEKAGRGTARLISHLSRLSPRVSCLTFRIIYVCIASSDSAMLVV